MPLGAKINQAVLRADRFLAGLHVGRVERRGSLISLFLHNLFEDEQEISRNLAYPQQCLTVDHLRQIIEYFRNAGFRFVSPVEIQAGLDPRGRHVLLTFDDGYFNNTRALPLMEKYGVPGLFFVPIEFVVARRGFWWDTLYRQRRAAGVSQDAVFSEIHQRAVGATEEIEAQLKGELQVSDFMTVGDTDRLFTPEELHRFAQNPLVWIGNHGCLHEYLTCYSDTEAAKRIARAQSLLHDVTGRVAETIAYPSGATSRAVVEASRAAGIKLGFTTELRKEHVGALGSPDRRMEIGRFTVWGDRDIPQQCQYMRNDVMLHARYRRLVNSLKRRA